MASKYLLLSQAAEFCSYSQEYLSLRARQGKLRAVKIGRNWFTTEDWLREYLDNINNYITERFLLFDQENGQQERSRVSWWDKILKL